MSKLIKMTHDNIEKACEEFRKALLTGKFPDGKINFTRIFGSTNRKATVFFSELAWVKMQTLIREFDKEVAWHGLASRGKDESKDEYYITDILVYPQKVTGVTVNTDQVKYQTWLMEHDDDVFNQIRMQGHSHVNMSTSPSGVDDTFYEKILNQLDEDMFYIFMVWNKKNEKTIKIYDMAKNVLFETNDVKIEILDGDIGFEKFLKSAKEMVNDAPTTYGSGRSYKGYTGYAGYEYLYSQEKYEPPQKAEQNANKQSSKKKKRRKRKDNNKTIDVGNGQQPSPTIFNCVDDNLNQYI